jgi:hypothetical protein
MREIQLTKGYKVIVDDDDYENLSAYRWYATAVCGHLVYAGRKVRCENGERKELLMHRVIMCAPDGMEVDHVNANTLDNRKCNLRLCSHMQNSQNQPKNSRNTSGYKGVSWNKKCAKWEVRIKVAGKRLTLGYFSDITAAAASYAEASREHHGDFGRLE